MRRVSRLQKGLESLGVKTVEFYLGEAGIDGPTPFYILAGGKLSKSIRGVDVVHAGGVGPAGITSVFKMLQNDPPILIYDAHGDVLSEARLIGQQEALPRACLRFVEVAWLERLALLGCDAAVPCSRPLGDLLRREGFSKPIETIWNGVETGGHWSLNPPSSSKFIVSYVGGSHPWQGLDLLLDAVPMISQMRNVVIRFVGPTESDIKAILRSGIPQNVEVYPWVTDPGKLSELMESSHAFILPRKKSRVNEVAFPTKFGEFCAIGRPVISTEVGEVGAIVNREKCGVTCEPTADGLVKAIYSLENADISNLMAMSENARRVATDLLDIHSIAARYLAFLRRLTSGREARES